MHKIMIIRHAEKHLHGSRGVTEDGRPASHELTVRGWERAAALIRLFAPSAPAPKKSAIETPRSIFASNATRESPSLRAMHTVGPLAAALGMEVNHRYAEGDEDGLAPVVLAAPSPVLIAWHHGNIAKLTRIIAGTEIDCPSHWPEDRFDVVWILARGAHDRAWRFSQVAQCLLPNDCPDVI
jgi:broad specificity phosphatase PhoE